MVYKTSKKLGKIATVPKNKDTVFFLPILINTVIRYPSEIRRKKMERLKKVKTAYIILTICFMLVGVTLLFWPIIGLDMLCKIYGTFLIAYGIAKLSSYFTKDLFQLAFQFDFGLGVFSIILGFVMFFRTRNMVEFMAVCIGIFMLIDGALKIQTSIEAKRFGIQRWVWILVTSIITGTIGALLLFSPFTTTRMIVRIVGLGICIDGVMNIIVIQNTVRSIRSAKEVNIEL